MNKRPAISAIKLASIFDILAENGIDRNAFLSSVNIDLSLFENPDKKLTISQADRFFKKAVETTNNDNIGLLIGRKLRYFPNIVCYVMMNSDLLGKALNNYCKYQRVCNEVIHTELYVEDNVAFVECRSTYISTSLLKHISDYILSSLFNFIQYLTSGKIKLREVKFNHKSPEDISEYKRFFRCPVQFEADKNSLVFDKKYLDYPIKHPNKELLDLFEKQAQRTLNALSKHESFSEKVCSLYIKLLQEKPPSIEKIARSLKMSVRKLQMHLENEGTSYKDLLNKIRKELAFGYLNDSEISIAEVSYLLGFSEPSAFHRAFKRWTGSTPGQYRMISTTAEVVPQRHSVH